MEGRRIILNYGGNETAIEGGEAGYADGVLWLYLPGITLARAYRLLSSKANVASIAFEYGEMRDEWQDMTRLSALFDDGEMIRAALKKEVEAVV